MIAWIATLALAADLSVGNVSVAWSLEPHTLQVAPLGALGMEPPTNITTHTLPSPIHQFTSWHGGWVVLVGEQAPRSAWWIGPDATAAQPIIGAEALKSLAVDPLTGQLVLGDMSDTLTWVPWFSAGVSETGLPPRPKLPGEGVFITEWRDSSPRKTEVFGDVQRSLFAPVPVDTLIAVPGVGLLLADEGDLTVVSEWMTADQSGVASAGGQSSSRIDSVLWAGFDRGVTLSQTDDGLIAHRWSLLDTRLPIPMHLGSFPLDRAPLAALPLQDGVWLVDDGPLRPGPATSDVQLGTQLDARAVARVSSTSQRLVWLTPQGPVVRKSAHPLLTEAPTPAGNPVDWKAAAADLRQAYPQASALARDLQRADLPIGPNTRERAAEPSVTRASLHSLVESATVFYRTPLTVAENFLRVYQDPDDDLARVIAHRRTELADQSMRIALGMLFFSLLGILGVVVSVRRSGARQEVLAASYNPFRDDSPNQPSRTPFSSDRLVDDVLRTLHLNCVVVEAPRFSGKSALLRHLRHRLETEGLGGEPARVVHLPLSEIRESAFWTRLGNAVAAHWPEEEVCQEVMEEDSLDRATVEYLLDELLSDEERDRLVLVLDDLDQLGLYSHEAQRFRGLIQVIPSHRMAILAAGTSIRRGWRGDADESPWFNIFQVRKLHPWTSGELRTYLEARLQAPFSFTSDVPDRLHELTGGRPLQVWHICFAAVERLLLDRRFILRPRDLEQAAARVRGFGLDDHDADTADTSETPAILEEPPAEWEEVLQRIGAARQERDRLLQILSERRRAREATEAETDFFGQGGETS